MSTLKTTNIAHPSSASNNIVLDSSGNVVLQAGSASTPALQPSGDTNTGIFFPAADTIAFAEGGSEAARLDSSGRLLVGTSSSRSVGGASGVLQIENNAYPSLTITNNTNDIGSASIKIGKSRGTANGSNTIVQNGDYLGSIVFAGADGTDLETVGASIAAVVDGTPGANDLPSRLEFSTTADGASSPTERMRITSGGLLYCQGVYDYATASSSNVNVFSNGHLTRNTSSLKYKTDIETLEDSYADAILDCRPVWYRSLCQADNPSHSFWGFIAEEVAEIDPRLVHWKTEKSVVNEDGTREVVPLDAPEPDGVQYDRFVPHLLNLIKRQGEAITELQAKVAALEAP